MSRLVEEFKASLQAKGQKQRAVDKEEKKKLIEEGMGIAKELADYGQRAPSVDYLTASSIKVTTDGLEPDRYNINRDKIPASIVKEAVDKSRNTLKELDTKTDGIFKNFSADVAEICLAGEELTKGAVLKKLRKDKNEELTGICIKEIPVHGSLTDIRLETGDFHVRKARYDTNVEFYSYKNNFDFLYEYNSIKSKLLKLIYFTFKGGEK